MTYGKPPGLKLIMACIIGFELGNTMLLSGNRIIIISAAVTTKSGNMTRLWDIVPKSAAEPMGIEYR